jgi:hypothetical protein
MPHLCYMPRTSHPSWLDHSNYTWRRVQVMEPLVTLSTLRPIGTPSTNSHTCLYQILRFCWRTPSVKPQLPLRRRNMNSVEKSVDFRYNFYRNLSSVSYILLRTRISGVTELRYFDEEIFFL